MLKKLYVLIITILVAAVLVTGVVSYQVLSNYNDRNNRQYLLSAASVIQQELVENQSPSDAANHAMSVFNRDDAVLRITIVNRQGTVLFDNEADSSQMDNHLYRPEIAYAFKNHETGYAVRRSRTMNTDLLYAALYDADRDSVIRTAMPVFASKTGLYEMLLTVLIVLAVSLVVLVAVASLTTRWITRPLQDLNQAATAMAAGHYGVRMRQLRQNDREMTALANAFNSMAERLQTTVRDLEDRNVRLDVILNTMTDPLLAVSAANAVTFMNQRAREVFGRDLDPTTTVYPLLLITHSPESEQLVTRAVAEGKTVKADLAMMTVQGMTTYLVIASPIHSAVTDGVILSFHDVTEARKLQKMRSEFVANVTHELRTPLTSIRGFIETLRNGAVTNPAVAGRFLDIIDIEAERLNKLINDILSLSEIEDLHEDKDQEIFDLNALIDDAAVLLDDAATAGKISLIVEHGGEPLPVKANRYRIKQILINLIDNAIKYNQEDGKVYINAIRQTDGTIRLSVRDTGVGIDPEHQDRVFERFYRVDKSRSRELGGTGLGLSIVKHIAQLYGGYATVDSRIGEGSTFTVVLKI
ncbi:MAG: ATP-binding protein [Clostridiaceae bacterium]|nr:ATP-binding protein [Clostridiaceae bacterium]